MYPTLATLFLAVSLSADPEAIRFPKVPEPALPLPAPVPPDARTVLKKGQRYVIDADVELFIRASVPGRVIVTSTTGPVKIIGEFVDKPGVEDDERTFSGKFVYLVKAAHAGPVDLIVIPKGLQSENEIRVKLLDVQDGTKPQPPPDPEPKPDEKSPIPHAGFRVLIVHDVSTALTLEHSAIMYGKASRTYLDSVCVKVGGVPDYRVFDKNAVLAGESELWKAAMTRPRTKLPWLIISNGKTGFEGPLPATEKEFMELCKKYEVKP